MKRKLYCCATDWLHEITEAPDLEGRMPFFSSVERLMAAKPCWSQCGIVEIEVTLERWAEQVSKELGELDNGQN